MLDFSIYFFYRAGTAIINALPLPILFRLGNFLGLIGWCALGKYRRLACHNLTIAFGREKTRAEIRALTRRHFARLGANLLCSVKMGTMPLPEMERRVTPENYDAVREVLKSGGSVVLVLSHMGNWEIFAQLFPRLIPYGRPATVFQKLRNERIDRDVRRKRARAGVELFDRGEGFHPVIELLREGGLVGILGDQHAGDHGVWTPFFGRLASTSSLSGLLAKRTHAQVFSAAIYTDGIAHWRMVFTDRIDAPNDSVEAITAKANATIERQIRRAPGDWFWVHNRWKTPNPNFLLSKYRRGVYLPREMPAETLQPFRILVRAPNWLGDSVISAPAIRAIKAGRPDAHITILAPKKIETVWKLIAEVDEILPIENRSLAGVVRLIRRQARFDAAIVLPNSLRSALEVWLAAIPRRVGFAGHSRKWLLNEIVPEDEYRGPIQHQAIRYLKMARHLGASVENVQELSANLSSRNGAPLKIGLCPGAEYGPAKRWLPERFAEAASLVSAEVSARWILFGTKADEEIGVTIAATLGENCVNRIGKTSLEDLIAELRECRALLTNDTGTMHLATLLGVPVIAIFGSTEPRLTGPLGNRNRILRHQVECSPCFLRDCPIDFRCMKAVSAMEAAEAVLAELR